MCFPGALTDILCFLLQMTFTALVVLLTVNFAAGSYLDDDHYVDQQHNPGRDINVLLGNQVVPYLYRIVPCFAFRASNLPASPHVLNFNLFSIDF